MEKARNGDVEIAYECLGPSDGMPLLMIPGSGMQSVHWPAGLCEALVARNFRVIRMDNRDSGLSTRLTAYDQWPGPRGKAYTLRDMADDVVAVLDAIGLTTVHLLGASLGATIAEVTAVRHPDRLRSLILLSANAGAKPWLARPRVRTVLRAMKIMSGPSPDADAEAERQVRLMKLVGSPDYPVDEAHYRAAGRLAFERGVYGEGSKRHTIAMMGELDLRPELATLTIPTLVVQGQADPMQSWKAARTLANTIPNARFLLLPGVGHDLPREVWPQVLTEITTLTTLTTHAEPAVGETKPPT